MKSFSVVLICVALASAPVVAVAQDDLSTEQQQRLVRLIDEGKDAYDAGNFEASLEKFRQAYDLYRHPDIVYRIALCYERLGEDLEAVKHYRQFLVEAPDAPERQRIEKTIQVIEERIAKSEIRVTSDPNNAEVFVNDTANGVAGRTPTTLPVKPGNYTLIVQKDGYEPVRELVTVEAGQSLQVRYQLSPSSNSTRPRDSKSAPGSDDSLVTVPIVGLTALGIGTAVTSIVFFGLHKDKADLVRQYEENSEDVTRTQFDREKRRRDMHLVIAVSSAVVSVGSLVAAYGLITSKRVKRARAATLDLGWDDGPAVWYTVPF